MNERRWRCRLYALAWDALSKLGQAPAARVEVEVNDGTTTLRLGIAPPGDVVAGGAGAGAALRLALRTSLSSLEQLICQTLQSGPLNAKTIALRTRNTDAQGQASHLLRSVVSNLCERGILEDEDGYRLTADGVALARLAGLFDAEKDAS